MKDMEKMSDQLKKANIDISRGDFNENDLEKWTKLTIKMKSAAALCSSNNEAALLDLKSVVDGLGEKLDSEDSEVTKKRNEYQKEQDELNKALAKCNLYVLSSGEVANHIGEAEKSYFKQKYLARTPNIVELVVAYLGNPVAILEESGEFIISHSGVREIDALELGLSILAGVLSIFVGLGIRKKLRLIESRRQWQDVFSENLIRATLTTLAQASPYLVASFIAAFASVVITLEVEELPFVTEFFVGLLGFFVITTLIKWLFSPVAPAKLFVSFTPHIAESLAKRLRVLSILSLIGYLAFYTVFSESIIESNLLLARNIFSLFYVVNVVWTLQVIIKSPKVPRLRYISMFVIVALLVSLVAEWLGYRNLAFGSRRIIMVSFVFFVIFIGIAKVLRDLFNAIDEGKYPWCRRLHKTLGVETGARVPGLIWIRLLATIAVWGSFALILINTWDYSGGVIEQTKGYIVNGFDIGDFRIIPSRILWAVLIFGIIVILSGWVRSQLENNWLRMTTMGTGARDAMVTIIGYIMFLIAILAGLCRWCLICWYWFWSSKYRQ